MERMEVRKEREREGDWEGERSGGSKREHMPWYSIWQL